MSAETLTVPTPPVEHPPAEPTAGQRERLVDATLRCVARWGVAKTSLDDVAREAGVSRATLYRLFPGGRDALFDAVVGAEIERFFREVSGRLETATTLEDLLVAGIHESGRRVLGHPALQYLLAHEPEIVLPKLAFHGFDGVLRVVGDFAAPCLGLPVTQVPGQSCSSPITACTTNSWGSATRSSRGSPLEPGSSTSPTGSPPVPSVEVPRPCGTPWRTCPMAR